MKISICVPQYNRIQFLLLSLSRIERQTYPDIEVVISDDCSTDTTEENIKERIPKYKYPLIYHRNPKNIGYDANYRKSIELATGDYCIVIGNDDSINNPNDIASLVKFLQENNLPEIGFTNFIEEQNPEEVIKRAQFTGIIGSGPAVALKNYSCFSFVGGLIYKRSAFMQYTTSKHDGSIYAQMYLGTLMIANGCRLFGIEEPLILKDINAGDSKRLSYLDKIARSWKDFKPVDAGLLSVSNVLISAIEDAGYFTKGLAYKIVRRIYTVTYPFWIQDYKGNNAFVEAVGIAYGMFPARNYNLRKLSTFQRTKIYINYSLVTIISFIIPHFIFKKLRSGLYGFAKKNL